MRIVHLGKYFPPDRGGMERFLQDLAEMQVEHGHDVRVLAHALNAPPGREHPEPRLEVLRCRVLFHLGRYAPVAPSLLRHLLSIGISRTEPTVLHAHVPNPAALWIPFLPLPVPLILHWHADVQFPAENAPSPALVRCWNALEQHLLRRADRIIATSEAYLAGSLPLRGHHHKSHVVPLGLRQRNSLSPDFAHPAPRFLRRSAAPGALNILAVGRLSHYKGFSVLLEALRRLPQASLCLVGEGEERPVLENMVQHPDIRERVLLPGDLPDAALRACFQCCDVLVLPSLTRSEAFGMVLLEAMREGKPCVVSNVPGSGMGSVVRDGETGLLIRPGIAEELVDALKRLAADPPLRRRMGAAGRQRLQRGYRLEDVARAVDSVYAEACRERSCKGLSR